MNVSVGVDANMAVVSDPMASYGDPFYDSEDGRPGDCGYSVNLVLQMNEETSEPPLHYSAASRNDGPVSFMTLGCKWFILLPLA